MCGILGTANLAFDRATLDLMQHRGPDGEGLTLHQVGPHSVTMGHRRLAIVDLSESGAQPMSLTSNRKHIIFNGEIYNHQDIRATLGGHYRGHSDTETLLQLLGNSGIDAVRILNGIFSLAFLDQNSRKLYLARDPFGVKPLYYSVNQYRFCFSSELTPLRGMVDTAIDPQALTSLLKLRFIPSPRTLHREIRKLRPGHILEVDLGDGQLSWREYPYIGQQVHSRQERISFEAAVDKYGHLFEQAVNRQLMSDVEVGVLLSGGIDSALVAACAQRASRRPLKAFTVGFTEADVEDIDEIDAARQMAEHLGMEHHVARIGFGDFLETLESCVQIVEEPLATTSIVPMHFLAKLAGQHVKVVMSGQGADELLGGYRRYQVELWRRFLPSTLAQFASNAAARLGVKSDSVVRGLKALAQDDEITRFLSAYEVFSNKEILDLTGMSASTSRNDVEYMYDLLGCRMLPSSVERMMAIDARMGLADDLLLYTDKITMRESVECRVPMLDLELATFLESLPYHHRLRIGKSKIIHSEYARRRLPDALTGRPKKGFLSPTRVWFRQEAKLRELLLDASSPVARYLSRDAIADVITAHQRGVNKERQIFLLLCLNYCLGASGTPTAGLGQPTY